MTVSSPAKLAYQRKYNDRPEMRRRNALQKRAWRAAVKAGQIHPGDGKAVDHVKALDDGGGNEKGNTRVISARTNAGWRKGTSSYSPSAGRLNR